VFSAEVLLGAQWLAIVWTIGASGGGGLALGQWSRVNSVCDGDAAAGNDASHQAGCN